MATNGNDRKPFYWCIRILKWIPVIFILTIVMWSYYAYVIQLCFITIESPFEKTIYLLFYHLFFVMLLWSYWQTIFTPVATVPSIFKVPANYFETLSNSSESIATQNNVLEAYAKNLPVVNVTLSGAPRLCDKCKVIKPDRAHHCSVCGVCILKMDHHCPWINNCVSFTNYKFFILFLGYALLFCLYITLTSLSYFIMFWKGDLQGIGKFHILFVFCVAFMFGISLMSLFGYHCYLVLMNRTTLEAFRPPSFRTTGPDKYGFHIGKCKNFQEVFGEDPKKWFLPVGSSLGDGVTFPRRLVSMT